MKPTSRRLSLKLLCRAIQLNIEQSIVHDHRQHRSMCHCRHQKLHIQRQRIDEELRVLTSKRIHCVNMSIGTESILTRKKEKLETQLEKKEDDKE